MNSYSVLFNVGKWYSVVIINVYSMFLNKCLLINGIDEKNHRIPEISQYSAVFNVIRT